MSMSATTTPSTPTASETSPGIDHGAGDCSIRSVVIGAARDRHKGADGCWVVATLAEVTIKNGASKTSATEAAVP